MATTIPYTLLNKHEIINIIEKISVLNSNDIVIDLGPFLGGSTAGIIAGLKRTNHKGNGNHIYCYDRYKVETSTTLGKIVLSQMEDLNEDKNIGTVDFMQIFKKNILAQLNGTAIKVKAIQGEISDLKAHFVQPKKNQRVGLIHVDLPKNWINLKPIIDEIFTQNIEKTVILWQDYFYHYSADIIITCEWLLEQKLLKLNGVVCSTLDTTLQRSLSKKEIDDLESTIYSKEKRSYYLKRAIDWAAAQNLPSYLRTSIELAEILDSSLPGISKPIRNENANLLLNRIEQNPAVLARRIIEVFEDLNGQREAQNW